MVFSPEKIFSRLKTSSPAQALNILKESQPIELRGSLPVTEEQSGSNSWNDVHVLLSLLTPRLSVEQWPDDSQRTWQRIVELCAKRRDEEAQAKKSLLFAHAFELWQSVGHLHSGALKRRLQGWLTQKALSDTVNCEAHTAVFGRWRGLLETARSAAELAPALEDSHPNAQDWESVLLHMLRQKPAPSMELDIFGKCELCWRFVPLAQQTGHHHLYCHEHQWNTLEYKRALKVNAALNTPSRTVESHANRLYAKTSKQWFAYHQNLPEDWVIMLRDDVQALAQEIKFPMEYHAGLIERYFPRVCALIVKKGGSITAHHLVNMLDPIPDRLPEEIRSRWQALHHVFISNLALFRRELCHAEVFLNMYERLYSGVKRGGARPRKKT